MTSSASTIRMVLMALCLGITLTIMAVTCFHSYTPGLQIPPKFYEKSSLSKPSTVSNHQGKWGKSRLANEGARLLDTTPLNSSETANMDVLQERKQPMNPDSLEGEGSKRIKNYPQQHATIWTMSSDENTNLMSQHKPTPQPIPSYPQSQGNNPHKENSPKLPGASSWEGKFDMSIRNDRSSRENQLENPGLAQDKPPIGSPWMESRPLIPPHKPWDLQQNFWAAPLRELVKTVSTDNQVALLFSTYSYFNSTLNWLIAAKVRCKPPVTNVIVVCYDMETYKILTKRDISSVFINPNTLLPGRKVKFTSSTRLIVMMTVTSWGYDVIQFDADAIVVKNPMELFERHPNSDIVASRARIWPRTVSEKWGFVACMGVVLFRSTPKIEFLWNVVRNKVEDGKGSDQELVNEAIDNFGITWLQSGGNSVDGVCKNGLRVTVLSEKDICRKKCKAYPSEGNREQTPYILHKLRGRKNGIPPTPIICHKKVDSYSLSMTLIIPLAPIGVQDITSRSDRIIIILSPILCYTKIGMSTASHHSTSTWSSKGSMCKALAINTLGRKSHTIIDTQQWVSEFK